MADVLNAACKLHFPHVLPDSRTLIRKLEGVQVPRTALLVTFDVVDMYPSINNAEAIQAACRVSPAHLRGAVQDMLHFVMDNSYCERRGQYYKQHGTAMGTSCAPPYANIYFAECVERILKQEFPDYPKQYFRLIDDGMFVWEGPRVRLDTFLNRMNTLLPNIKITWQISPLKVAYLDVWVAKDMSGGGPLVPIQFSTYQKPHNKYMYIPYSSHHRPSVFRGFIKGELIRYAVTNTAKPDFDTVCGLFRERLLRRGYPATLFDSITHEVQHSDRLHYFSDASQPASGLSAGTTVRGPVFIATNGARESQGSLSKVINGIYDRHLRHSPELADIFGSRIVVAYRNPPNVAKMLVRATH
jgi:hypothetical protein